MERILWLLIILAPLSLLGCEETCQPSAHRIHSTDSDYHCNSGTVVSKDENFIICQCPKGAKVVGDAGDLPEAGN